jgi:type IV secretion system protein TrbL
MSCTGIQLADPICAIVSSIGSIGSSVTNSVFSSVATAFGNTADSAINWLWSQMSSSTSVTLGGSAFGLDLGIVTSIAAVLCSGLFLVQLVTSALKQDGGGIGRALRGLAIATVGCAITLATLDLLLAAVDQLCAGVVQLATGGSIETLGAKIIDPALFTGLVAGPGAILILSLIAICAVAVVWFALVVRKMLIVVTAIFAPLAFAGGVADVSRGWVRKWLEAMLALVFSKLILILIFVIGLGVLGGMGSPANAGGISAITNDITGLLILLVAGLSPWMALKLVHFTGDHMATMAGSASHATSGASTIIGAPQKMASMKWAAQSLGGTQQKAGAPMGRGVPTTPTASGASGRATTAASGASVGGSAGVGSAAAAGAGVATAGVVLAASAARHAGRSVGGTVRSGVQQGSATGGHGANADASASSPPATSRASSGGATAARGSPAPSPTSTPTSPASHIAPSTSHRPVSASDTSPPSTAHRPVDEPTSPTTSFPSSVPPLRLRNSAFPTPKEIS